MDKEIISEVKMLADKARLFFDFEEIVIYGSYAENRNTVESDIDVAFVVDKISDNHFELSAKLFELVDKIDVRIEPLIINRKNDKSGFIEKILKNGYIIQ